MLRARLLLTRLKTPTACQLAVMCHISRKGPVHINCSTHDSKCLKSQAFKTIWHLNHKRAVL